MIDQIMPVPTYHLNLQLDVITFVAIIVNMSKSVGNFIHCVGYSGISGPVMIAISSVFFVLI